MLTIDTYPRVDVTSVKRHVTGNPGCSSVHLDLSTKTGLVGFDLRVLRDRAIFGERLWLGCPTCGRRRRHLYLVNDQLACRVCLHLAYPAWCWPDSTWRIRVGRPMAKAWRRSPRTKSSH